MDLVTLRLVVAVADRGSISAGSSRVQLALGAANARISSMRHAIVAALRALAFMV